jgi:hypothetical protein
MNKELIKQKLTKSCAVCKFAKHDVTLEDAELDQVICTVDPVKPVLKNIDDTCLRHELKYKNLKVIVEKSFLQEYDPNTDSVNLNSNKIPNAKEIGEKEWQK